MTNETAELIAAHLAAGLVVGMKSLPEDMKPTDAAVALYGAVLDALKARYVAPDAPETPDDVERYQR